MTQITWTAEAIADDVRSGRVTANDVLTLALENVARSNSELVSFVAIDEKLARESADEIDRLVADGIDPGSLAGVPIGVKDFEEEVRGFRTTAGSALLQHAEISSIDTPHVARLRAAGALIIGRTASAEFGLASDTATRAHGVTRNPWRRDLTPGGSSGGSAAAVASGQVPLATGSDSGGSIRSPASHCNLVGMKPSFGRIPLPIEGSTINVVGVLAKTPYDAALHLDVASDTDGTFVRALRTLDVNGARTVYSSDLGYNPVDPAIAEIVEPAALYLIAAAGLDHVQRQVSLPNVYPDYVFSAFAALRDRLDRDHSGDASLLTVRLQRALAHISQVPPEIVMHARRAAADVGSRVAALFAKVDLVITPVTTALPHAADGDTPAEIAGVDVSGIGVENFPMWANYAGLPSIALPAGFTRNGIPVGFLITAGPMRDDMLLRLASIWQTVAPWPLDITTPGKPRL